MSHFAFFEALQAAEQGSAEWECISCGYMVMRCFDDWRVLGPVQIAIGTAFSEIETKISRLAVSDASYANVFRAVLQSLREAAAWSVMSVVAPVIAYGTLLEDNGRWTLAADVYGTVADALDEEVLVPSPDTLSHGMARRRQAFSLRTKGNFDEAEIRYRQAIVTADRVKDLVTSNYARFGLTSLYRVKGDFLASLELLNTMIGERELEPAVCSESMMSEILHTRGTIRMEMEDYDGAFSDLALAYQTAPNPPRRDEALSDLGACAIEKGYYDFANTLLELVFNRTPNPLLKQFVAMNMMFLATRRGDESTFLRFRAHWDPHQCGDVVNAYGHFTVALALERFGTKPQARTAFRKAARFAEKVQLHKVHHDALKKLEQLQT